MVVTMAMKRYLVVLMRRRDGFDAALIPKHKQYLDDLAAQGRIEMTGPFSDGSGGAYLLRAQDIDEATQLIHADPGYQGGGWDITFYEWQVR